MSNAFDGKTLGVIGAGNMAEAIVQGVLDAGLIAPESIVAADPDAARRAVFTKMDVTCGEDNRAPAGCDVVLLAVKPQMMDVVLKPLADAFKPDALLISIAAGIGTERLARLLPATVRIVRAMPNAPIMVGAGATAVSTGPRATERDVELALHLFGGDGMLAEAVEERHMDVITALSGSGPAYVYLLAEALADAATKLGLPAEQSARFAAATIRGAGMNLVPSDSHPGPGVLCYVLAIPVEPTTDIPPAELRRRVTSPGGTTAAAIDVFEKGDFRGLVARAVEAAAKRAEELGRG